MEPLVIIGAANDGELVVDVVEDINGVKPAFEIVGFLDDDSKKQGKKVNGYPVIGPVACFRQLAANCKFVLTVASAKKTYVTKRIVAFLNLPPERFATLIHPQATVSRSASLGSGCVILPGVRINSRVRLGNYVLVEGNAWLGVGTMVGDYSVVTHDASISGDCVIDEGSYIGASCSIIGNTRIGAWSVVGAGAVVLRDVPPKSVVVGNPARQVGTVDVAF